MARPTDPANVAANSPATSSWANSVVDAILAILDDIYGVAALAIPWGSLTGVPATFTPSTHNHAAGAGGNVPWANVSGKPATFAPTAHAAAHGSAGADPVTPAAIGAATSGHAHTAASMSAPTTYNTPATPTTRRIYVGTATPTGASEGDIWIKG